MPRRVFQVEAQLTRASEDERVLGVVVPLARDFDVSKHNVLGEVGCARPVHVQAVPPLVGTLHGIYKVAAHTTNAPLTVELWKRWQATPRRHFPRLEGECVHILESDLRPLCAGEHEEEHVRPHGATETYTVVCTRL